MRKYFIGAVILAALSSCAKEVADTANFANQEAFNAMVAARYGASIVEATPLQTYILEDIPGTGDDITVGNYIIMDYWVKNFAEGTYMDYTYESIAKQLNAYSKAAVYAPKVLKLEDGVTTIGIIDGLKGGALTGNMKVGGKRTFIVPGWLTGVADLGSLDSYVANVTGTAAIYSVEVRKQVSDIVAYQVDSIRNYIKTRGIKADTTFTREICYGTLREPSVDKPIPADSTIYINYIGRLLNGKVFDTNIADTAKKWDVYVEGRTYGPESIKTKADSTAYTMGSSNSDLIKGFSLTLSKMRPNEKSIGIFTSTYGYGSSNQGVSIAPYSPLVFEIELVAKP